MAKVAEESGVSNGTLFHYFGTKQDLLDQLYEWLKADLIAAIGDVPDDLTATEQLRTLWMRWIDWVRRYTGDRRALGPAPRLPLGEPHGAARGRRPQ